MYLLLVQIILGLQFQDLNATLCLCSDLQREDCNEMVKQCKWNKNECLDFLCEDFKIQSECQNKRKSDGTQQCQWNQGDQTCKTIESCTKLIFQSEQQAAKWCDNYGCGYLYGFNCADSPSCQSYQEIACIGKSQSEIPCIFSRGECRQAKQCEDYPHQFCKGICQYDYMKLICRLKVCEDLSVDECDGSVLQDHLCLKTTSTQTGQNIEFCKTQIEDPKCDSFKTKEQCLMKKKAACIWETTSTNTETCRDKTCKDYDVLMCQDAIRLQTGLELTICKRSFENTCENGQITDFTSQTCFLNNQKKYRWVGDIVSGQCLECMPQAVIGIKIGAIFCLISFMMN